MAQKLKLRNPYGLPQRVLDAILKSKAKRTLIRFVFRRNGPTLDGLLRNLDEDLAKRNIKWLLDKGVLEKKDGIYNLAPDYLFTFKLQYNISLLRISYNRYNKGGLEELSARSARVMSRDRDYRYG